MRDYDDKDLAIASLLLIAIACIGVHGTAGLDVLMVIVTGIAALATGKDKKQG